MADRTVLVRLRADVSNLKAGLASAKSSVDDLTKAASPKKAEAFSALANKAALAGAAVATGIGVAVNRFADFDEAMSAVRANSGETGAVLEDLRSTAIKLGADSQFSATEAAQGINEMSKAGVNAKDILGGGLKGALDLAAAGQVDVAFAAESAATAMVQFRLDGSKVPHIADLMTNAANKAQGGVSDLAMALKQGGLVAAATGLSIEETTAGLAAFASAGLIGSDAGTSFKTMLMRLNPQSDAAAAAMEQIGLHAYDAAGNFIGLEAVAGQLRTGLAGLSQEQRTVAVNTIFGNDAARAANVLYEQGAEGIAKWTKEVSEQGAAAKQAATLTDNLKGDIERLGGAVDSVFIQTGSAANGGLRTLTKGITGFVDGVGRIPGPLLLAGGALTSFALLAPKGVLMWRAYTAQLDALGLSLDRIAAKSPRAAAGLRALGAASIVVGGLTLAGSGLETMWLDVAGANDEATESLKRYIEGGGKADGVTDIMRIGFSDLGATVEHAFGTAGMRGNIMGFFDEVGTGFGIFGPDKLTEARSFFEQIDSGLAGMVQAGNGKAAAEIFAQIAKEAQLQGVNIDQVKAALPGYSAAVETAGTAASTAATGTGEMVTETERLQQSAEEARDALDSLKTGLDILGGGQLAVRAATREWQQAMEDATATNTKAWKEGKTATEIARGQQAALDGIATSTDAVMKAQMDNGASTTELTKTYEAGRKKILEVLAARGIHGKAAEAEADKIMGTRGEMQNLIDTYGKTPKAVTTNVSAPGLSNSLANAQSLKRALEILDGTSVNTTVFVNKVERAMRGAPTGVFKAAGGPIYGPGTKTSDSVPIWASTGEFMQQASAVDKYGLTFMHDVNAGRFPVQLARAYRDGGPIGQRRYAGGGSIQGGFLDYRRLAAELAQVSGPTFIAQGPDAEANSRRAMREWEYRVTSRLP